MPRQAEQLLVDPRREQGAYRPRLHRRKVQALGQRRDRPPAIGIGRMPQIIDDQRELRVARARVDQPVDQGGEALHASSSPPSSSTSRPTRCSARALRSEERRVGKSVSVRVDLGGPRIIQKKKNQDKKNN